MSRVRRASKRLLHAAVLAFTGWWLIATSAPLEPVRDCFNGIGNTARLRVTLGSIEAPPDGGTPVASCAGIDGLAPGAVLTFELSHGKRPESTHDACYAYDTTSLTGAPDVTIDPPSPYATLASERPLTGVRGSFASTTRISCRGTWFTTLFPEAAPPAGQLISPLDAGASQRWFIRRGMDISQAQFCDGAFTEAGTVGCTDTFVVESIAEAP